MIRVNLQKYYNEEIDELIFIDTVATLYGRNQLAEIIFNASKEIFVPLTVGGGIRTIKMQKNLLSQEQIKYQ